MSGRILILLFVLLLSGELVMGQLLQKTYSMDVKQQPLSLVLDKIAARGQFSFSYNSRILNQDSLVSLSVNNMPLVQLLDQVIGRKLEYLENGGFIVIRKMLKPLTLITSDMVSDNKQLSLSGIVIDPATGERLRNASVYEKQQLISTLTDEHGYFRLKLHSNGRYGTGITLSKQGYRDTTFFFLETLSVYKGGKSRANESDFEDDMVEHTGLGNALISARKKLQSLNIKNFFANRPFQFSVAPEVSSHGMMGPQVVNNFSLNLTGGYTGGVRGMEMAGVFNINKKDMRYFQFAGIFNLTGGTVTGLQLSGVHNRSLGDVNGAQLSGFINSAEGTVKGIQIGGLNNYAKNLKGLQIGLVNIADSSSGLSIGLLNIIRSGFYSVSLSATKEMNTILTFKTGGKNLYTALIFGNNVSALKKQYAMGIGVGSRLSIAKALFADIEIDALLANEGSWDDRWLRIHGSLHYALTKNLSLFGGPVYNSYHTNVEYSREGYQNIVGLPAYGEKTANVPNKKNWLGWQAGIALNGRFHAAPPGTLISDANWELELGLTGGKIIDHAYWIAGGEIGVKKLFDRSFYGLFTTGYSVMFATQKDTLDAKGPNRSSIRFIPLKAGVRKMIGKKVYIGSDLGYVFGFSKDTPNHGSFLYAPNIGYQFSSSLAMQFRFEDFRSYRRQLGLKVSYKIPLAK